MLLLGHDDVIRACTANYVTDAICRKEDADRYDDRLMVRTNLIDAYEQLMEFISKHTSDKFFLVEDQSISIRSKISRELVSNILVHREYTSAYPAKIIIERDRIVTENWSIPKTVGRIVPDSFTPFPKNPLLANFFINIGRADVLGSGVRNLYKFTKMYSGGEPELIDGDVFRTVVPLEVSNVEMGMEEGVLEVGHGPRKAQEKPKKSPRKAQEKFKEISDKSPKGAMRSQRDVQKKIVEVIQLNPQITRKELAGLLDSTQYSMKYHLGQLTSNGVIRHEGSTKAGKWVILKEV